MFYKKIGKRIFDIVFSSIGIILFSPILLFFVLFILIEHNGPILFLQKRIGKDKTEFNILKFRTMKINTPKDCPTHLLDNPEFYITRVGKILRKTSLDELPQIFNIFVGHMSIVGPRPALWNQFDLRDERDKYKANDIVPGLTGWAQVNGRDELPIHIKAEYDGEYVRKMSLFFDIKIMFLTVFKVLSRVGVQEGRAATPEPASEATLVKTSQEIST